MESRPLPFWGIKKQLTGKPQTVSVTQEHVLDQEQKSKSCSAPKKASSIDGILVQALASLSLTVWQYSTSGFLLLETASGYLTPSSRRGDGKTLIPGLQAHSHSKSRVISCVQCQANISCALYAEAGLTPMCLCDSLRCRSALCC